MQVSRFRFRKSPASAALPKGAIGQYDLVANALQDPALRCILTEKHLRGTTTITNEHGALAELTSTSHAPPKWSLRKVGAELSNIGPSGAFTSGWTAVVGDSVYAIGDPRSIRDKVIGAALNGYPDGYVVLSNDHPIGKLTRKSRTDEASRGGLLSKLASLMDTYDWVLELEKPVLLEDTLVLLALVLPTVEITVPMDRS